MEEVNRPRNVTCESHDDTTTVTRRQFLSEKEAAAYIGMSVMFLRIGRMEGARKNRTPGPAYHKLGKSIRYRIADLESWLCEHRVILQKYEDQNPPRKAPIVNVALDSQ